VPLNVVISEIEPGQHDDHATIVVDTSHPTLFDHPLDHLPGMLVIEACKQTAIASATRRGFTDRSWHVDAMTARFHEFAEYDQHTVCHARTAVTNEELDGSATLACTVTATQAERRLIDMELTLTSRASGPVDAQHPQLSTPLLAAL
jgi:hypothetical protein